MHEPRESITGYRLRAQDRAVKANAGVAGVE
jgi:hypothetical protein